MGNIKETFSSEKVKKICDRTIICRTDERIYQHFFNHEIIVAHQGYPRVEVEYLRLPRKEPHYIYDDEGNMAWFDENGEFHRGDGEPAIVVDGTKEWWVHGERHRNDGPAIEGMDGSQLWFQRGKLERGFNEPAIVTPDYRIWFKEGEVHRDNDLPAKVWASGRQEWWLNGNCHRENGPAVESSGGHKEWWVGGERHRLDGPAIKYEDGTVEWLVNGKRHREGGPAVEYAHGGMLWYANGLLHRLDGPAAESSDGRKEWWLDGKFTTHQGICEKIHSAPTVNQEIYKYTQHEDYVVKNLAIWKIIEERKELDKFFLYKLVTTNFSPTIVKYVLDKYQIDPAWLVARRLVT